MKEIFAVALLMTSFASLALADGPFLPPSNKKTTKPHKSVVTRLADGPFLPPATGKPGKP
ncbi:MAG TPA: hypothetical protein VI386_18390 [Candidatus Sulfotelmatobacter sp.]